MDQANGLRELVQNSNVDYNEFKVFKNSEVIAVTSGKGGVGKSNFVANLAINMQNRGKKVLVIDADVGLANIELLYDIVPKKTFKNLLNGEDVNEVLQDGPFGIKLLSGGSGIVELANISGREQDILIQAFSYLEEEFDYILIDTGAGINDLVLRFLALADKIIVITLPEPTAITDAYALLKVAHSGNIANMNNFSIVVNRVSTAEEGEFVIRKLSLVAKKFLDLDVKGLGMLSEDMNLIQSVKKQDIMELYRVNNSYTRDIDYIASQILNLEPKYDESSYEKQGKIMSRLKKIFVSR